MNTDYQYLTVNALLNSLVSIFDIIPGFKHLMHINLKPFTSTHYGYLKLGNWLDVKQKP